MGTLDLTSSDRTRVLSEFGASLAAARLCRDEVASVATRTTQDALGGAAVLMLTDVDDTTLALVGVSHEDPEVESRIRALFDAVPHLVDNAVFGPVIRNHEPVFWPQVIPQMLGSAFPGRHHRSYFEDFGVRSLIVVPVRAHGDVIGALSVVGDNSSPIYTTDDVVFVSDLADRVGVALDNARLLHESRMAVAKAEAVFASAVDAIMVVSAAGIIESVNPATESMFGWSATEMIGKNVSMLMPPEVGDVHSHAMFRYLQTRTSNVVGTRRIVIGARRDGSTFPAEIAVSDVEVDGERLFTGVVRDVTADEEIRAQLAHLASTDRTTGMPNRHAFMSHLQQMIDDGCPFSLMFVDVDDFRSVNTIGGHHYGDAVLVEIAERMRRLLPAHCLHARWSGDQFMVTCADESPDSAGNLGERIAEAFIEPFDVQGFEPLWLTASIGTTYAPFNGITVDLLVQRAEAAMYHAKHGTNRVTHWAPGMQHPDDTRRQGFAELADALQAGHLELWFQPVSTPAGAVHGTEALIRWRHPHRGLVPPNEFIPLAEETRLIHRIGQFVIWEACRYAASRPDIPVVSINVSRVQLTTGGLAATVKEALRVTGINPNRLCVEVTESAMVHIPQASIAELEDLRSIGVLIALDDFGTGVSALTSLYELPIDIVKLDRGFITRLPEGEPLVAAAIEFVHNLGLIVTAEGIETAEQMEMLTSLGCDYFQGFFIGRPAPPTEVIQDPVPV